MLAFFEDYYVSMPIVDRSYMDGILKHYTGQGQRDLALLDQSLFLLVMALGACSRSSSNLHTSIDSASLYGMAWQLFPSAVAVPSPASVRVLLLHVSIL